MSKDIAEEGHNRVVSKKELTDLVKRIESVKEEQALLRADEKELFLEATNLGIDVKALRAILRLKRMEAEDRQGYIDAYDTYLDMCGLTIRLSEEAA